MFHVEHRLRIPSVVEGKQSGGGVAFLLLHATEVEAATEQAGWGAGLQASQLNPGLEEASG